MRSGIKLNKFLRVFLPTFGCLGWDLGLNLVGFWGFFLPTSE